MAVLGGNLPPRLGEPITTPFGSLWAQFNALGESPGATGRWPDPPGSGLDRSDFAVSMSLRTADVLVRSGLDGAFAGF